jgi:two-component system cell cycle response regulator DivK
MAPSAIPPLATVLLVEFGQDDRAMYEEYLRARGFKPLVTDNGDEALRRAAEADVIVTGVRLSGTLDGIEVVRRLRQDDRTKEKPIVVLTATTFAADRERAVAAGCDAFVLKPCLPDTLVETIQRARAMRTDPRPGGTPPGRAPRRNKGRAGK